MVNRMVSYLGHPTRIFRLVYDGLHLPLQEVLTRYSEEYKDLLDYIDSPEKHPLLFVACYGRSNHEVIDVLFAQGALSHHIDALGRNVVHIAANAGDPDIVRSLLSWSDTEYLVDAVAKHTGQTPFHALCYRGSEISPTHKSSNANLEKCWVEMLSKSKSKDNPKAILDAKDINGLTPVMIAKYYRIRELLNAFAKTVGQDYIDKVRLPENISELLKNDFWGRNSLHCAILTNNVSRVVEELSSGVSPDEVNPQYDMDALQLACFHCVEPEIILAILNKIANPLRQDSAGRTALHIAANRGSMNLLLVLLANKQIKDNINILDVNGRTALHAAVMHSKTKRPEGHSLSEREQVVDLLFEMGIDFEIVDKSANTPQRALEIAEQLGNALIAQRVRYNIQLKKPDQILPSPLVRFSSTGTLGSSSDDCFSPDRLSRGLVDSSSFALLSELTLEDTALASVALTSPRFNG